MEEIEIILEATKKKMSSAVSHFEIDLASIRAGKASTSVLDSVMVDYYGTPTPINQVASVTVPDARTILIQPWEKKVLEPIERAIMVANLGFTPSNNGDQIRISVPALTEERRATLVKQAKGEAENTKVAVRNVRRDSVDGIKKAQKNGLGEDLAKDAEASVQKITDGFIKVIDELFVQKEKDIMTI